MLFAALALQATLATPFMRQPDIHGDQIVFVNEGDLWLGNLATTEARRLTNDVGLESTPAFSPDGKQIAYTAEYEGERQAYVIDVTGGLPKRLTSVSGFRRVTGWTADGTSVIFRKAQAPTNYGYFTVPVKGGAPTPFPLEFASNVSMAPSGKDYTFTRFNRWSMAWFRYIGGMQNQIWVSREGKFSEITKLPGTNEYPVWVGDRIYFANEQEAKFSLMSVPASGGRPRLEYGPTPLEIRELNTDGTKIVFERGREVDSFNPNDHKLTPVTLPLVSDLVHAQPFATGPEAFVQSASVTSTGKRAFVESRGQILSLPFGEGEARIWKAKAGVRYRYPVMSPDGTQVAYFSDATGEVQLYVSKADGTAEKQLTTDTKRQLTQIIWSPDSKSLLVFDTLQKFQLVNLTTGKEQQVAQVDLAFNAPPADFSPDSKFIVYVAPVPGTQFNQAFLFEIATGKTTKLSNGRSYDVAAAFSNDGSYIALLSQRSIVSTPDTILNQLNLSATVIPILLPLRADVPNPFDPKDPNEEPKKEEKKEEPKKDEKKPEPKMELQGIWDRRIELPVAPGAYNQIAMVNGKVFLSDGQMIRAFDVASKQLSDLTPGNGFDFSGDKSKLFTVMGPRVVLVDPNNPTPKVASYGGIRLHIDPQAEWKQMYWDAWRLLRDYFYISNMHGVDWDAIGKKYAEFLPSVRSRDELDELIRWLQAELGSSHEYVAPGDARDLKKRVATPGLGIDIVPDQGYYKITKLIRGDGFLVGEQSPLIGAGKSVKEGMYLIEVAGVPATSDSDPFSGLTGRAGQVVTVKVNDKPSPEGAKSYLVKPVADESRMRYVDWVETNRKYVEKATGGRIGYLHMSAMSNEDFNDFVKQYFAQRDKEALIVDDRFNNGGYVQDYINRILAERLAGFFNLRNSRLSWTRQSDYFNGPMACLINEFCISCGEEFPHRFRDMKLGPLIGRRTMGGEVGSDPGWPLADGGKVYVPAYGFWTPKEGWQIEGRGVEPDIDVPSDPNAYLKGKDPQIDKAIEVLMKQLPAKPSGVPTAPANRDRVKNPK